MQQEFDVLEEPLRLADACDAVRVESAEALRWDDSAEIVDAMELLRSNGSRLD